jgi:hypothetical protein
VHFSVFWLERAHYGWSCPVIRLRTIILMVSAMTGDSSRVPVCVHKDHKYISMVSPVIRGRYSLRPCSTDHKVCCRSITIWKFLFRIDLTWRELTAGHARFHTHHSEFISQPLMPLNTVTYAVEKALLGEVRNQLALNEFLECET